LEISETNEFIVEARTRQSLQSMLDTFPDTAKTNVLAVERTEPTQLSEVCQQGYREAEAAKLPPPRPEIIETPEEKLEREYKKLCREIKESTWVQDSTPIATIPH